VIEPNGAFIERPELDEHFDGGRFPGLRRLELVSSARVSPKPGPWFGGLS
jgi:hypothetical protein